MNVNNANKGLSLDEQEARARFSSHVQSTAFHLTLSRRMVAMLEVIRNEGLPGSRITSDDYYRVATTANETLLLVPLIQSLVRRGLVLRGPLDRLSEAGVLLCRLLVIGGMMAPEPGHKSVVKRARNKRKEAS